MKTSDKTLEQISALSDGELADDQVAMAIAALRRPKDQAAWDVYHHIGDVLRSDEMVSALSPDFFTRFSARLEAEPTIVVAQMSVTRTQAQQASRGFAVVIQAMNRFTKSRLAAGVVIVMAAAAILSVSPLATKPGDSAPSQSASSMLASVRSNPYSTVDNSYALHVSDVNTKNKESAALQDARTEAYLLAHQRFSSSLLGTVQYARMASFATDSNK